MRPSPSDAAIIRAIPLLAGIPAPVLAGVLERVEVSVHPVGTLLFTQDEPADRFFVVLDGWIKLFRLQEDGTEVIIHIIGARESFAEAAMFESGRFPVCAEPVTEARVAVLSAQAMSQTVADHPTITFAMLAAMSRRLRQLVQQIEQLQAQSAPQRVAGFLLRYCPAGADRCTLTLPLQKALIAKRLGMRPETFSRALAKLETIGVDRRDGGVAIASVSSLRAFCQSDPADGDP